MLVSFSVSNFLSFNNEERFEMKAGRVLKKKEPVAFSKKRNTLFLQKKINWSFCIFLQFLEKMVPEKLILCVQYLY